MKLKKILAYSVLVLTVCVIAKQAINAADATVKASIENIKTKVKQNENVTFDVYLDSGKGNKLSGATAVIEYSPESLKYDDKASSVPSEKCKDKGYKLNQSLNTKDDKKNGVVHISRILIEKDDKLPSGSFCFGTFVFKAKLSGFWSFLPWVNSKASIKLGDAKLWEMVGPGKKYSLEQSAGQSANSISITH